MLPTSEVDNIYFIETNDRSALSITGAEAEESWVLAAYTQYWVGAQGSAAGIDSQEPDCLWRTYTVCMRCHNSTGHLAMNMPPDLSRLPNQQ